MKAITLAVLALYSMNIFAVDLDTLQSGDKLSGLDSKSGKACVVEIMSRTSGEGTKPALELKLTVGDTTYKEFSVIRKFSVVNQNYMNVLSKERKENPERVLIENQAMLRTGRMSGKTSLTLLEYRWYEHSYTSNDYIICEDLQ